MDLVSRLKFYLDSRQISVTQFADECGIPRPTGSQLLTGRNKKVSNEIIEKIHAAYPELNTVWLLFGEGDMVKIANIESSEPQIAPKEQEIQRKEAENQTLGFEFDFNENNVEENQSRNSANPTSTNTFTFAPPPDAPVSEAGFEDTSEADDDMTASASQESLTIPTGKGKRVTGIVVYYDDCTYESFIPDPNHGHPFMR